MQRREGIDDREEFLKKEYRRKTTLDDGRTIVARKVNDIEVDVKKVKQAIGNRLFFSIQSAPCPYTYVRGSH